MPPGLEARLLRFGLTELRVTEQDGVERAKDLAAIVDGVGDGVGVLEWPVFRVGPFDVQPSH